MNEQPVAYVDQCDGFTVTRATAGAGWTVTVTDDAGAVLAEVVEADELAAAIVADTYQASSLADFQD